MEYRAVRNRIAVSINCLKLPISNEETLTILNQKGFKAVKVDIISLARECIGKSKYSRGVRSSEAPAVLDCSSFIKWLYGERGIWLPRRSIQQREVGQEVNLEEIIAGDVVFVSGRIDYYDHDLKDGVGHVGIASGEGTIIHAANKKSHVIETPIGKFIGKKFRGVRRYIPKDIEVLTFETPLGREIETADDIRWIVLQSL